MYIYIYIHREREGHVFTEPQGVRRTARNRGKQYPKPKGDQADYHRHDPFLLTSFLIVICFGFGSFSAAVVRYPFYLVSVMTLLLDLCCAGLH